MALLSPQQIKDAIAQRAAVAALQQSYDASKVVTTIEKQPVNVGDPTQYYTTEEMLQSLKASIEALSGVTGNETLTDAEIASIFSDS